MVVRVLAVLAALTLAGFAWLGMDHRSRGPITTAATGPCRGVDDPTRAVALPDDFADLLRVRAGVLLSDVGTPTTADLDTARERRTMAGYGGDPAFACTADVRGGDAKVDGPAVLVVREHVDVPGFGPSGAEGSSLSTTCVTFVRPGSGAAYGGGLCFSDGSGPPVATPTEPPKDA